MALNSIWHAGMVSLENFLVYKCKDDGLNDSCLQMIWIYKKIYDFSFFLGMLAQIISYVQIYEWASMKLIILWQSTKDLTQVIIQMNDIEERKLFHSLETKLKKWL